MTRAAVRQSDVLAAVAGARKAGLQIGRVEITPEGRILILPAAASGAPMGDELDDELATWRRERDEN